MKDYKKSITAVSNYKIANSNRIVSNNRIMEDYLEKEMMIITNRMTSYLEIKMIMIRVIKRLNSNQ